MNLSQIRLYLISKNISVEKADEIIPDVLIILVIHVKDAEESLVK